MVTDVTEVHKNTGSRRTQRAAQRQTRSTDPYSLEDLPELPGQQCCILTHGLETVFHVLTGTLGQPTLRKGPNDLLTPMSNEQLVAKVWNYAHVLRD